MLAGVANLTPMEATDTTARLTEREKEALRLWLGHRTAKEIALDLGISHHAVEKRLNMARTKLGAASSLEAARILAEAEGAARGYQQTVTGPPDLPATSTSSKPRQHQPYVIGGLAMLIATALVFALAATFQPAEPIEIELNSNIEPIFNSLDENGSGFLEDPESPFVELALLDTRYPVEMGGDHNGNAILGDSSDPDQVAEFYAAADTDADNRVSFREYYAWSQARLAEMGIEVTSVVKALPAPQS